MAIKGKRQGRFVSVLHFLSRCLGLLGLAAALVGAVLSQLPLMQERDDSKQDIIQTVQTRWDDTGALIRNVTQDTYAGPPIGKVAVWMMVGAVPAVALALLVEVFALLILAAGRRTLSGTLVVVQVALALFVLGAVNFYSFQHYQKVDLTRPGQQGVGQFTLPSDVQTKLRTLNRETTIVVLQRRPNKANEDLNEGAYVAAAEGIIVQKVRDLAEMMREFGPQFRVVVLDAKNKEFKNELERETKGKPKLAEAIQQASESSILFYSELDPPGEKGDAPKQAYVRRLPFDDFYQLDKSASLKGEGGDLALQEKGVNRFINCVLNIDEKRPKVGVLVIHEVLTTQTTRPDFTLKGVRESLTRDGYDVIDVVTAVNWPRPEAGVETVEETRYLRLSEQIAEGERDKADTEAELKDLKEGLANWKDKPLKELEQMYKRILAINRIERLTPELRKRFIELIEDQQSQRQQELERTVKSLEKAKTERAALDVDAAAMLKHMTDIQAKLRQIINECDLLLIPRITRLGTGANESIPYNYHRIGFDANQTAIIKGFLAQGKPILACFGPNNDPPRQPDPSIDRPGPDEIEQLFAELGIEFGKQTILFPQQIKDYAARSGSPFDSAEPEAIPPLDFQKSPGALAKVSESKDVKPHPLRDSLRLTSQGLGKEMDLQMRFARPVYYNPGKVKQGQPGAPQFLLTSADAWNDAQPYATAQRRVPRFQKPKDDDPTVGTLDETRQGTFSVGVAVEADIPETWKPTERKTVRVIGIGHASWLVDDKRLSPGNEALLLDSCDWLLGRDERLNKPSANWTYPRVAMARDEKYLWLTGASIGLPLLFGLLGILVLLARSVR